MNIRLNPTLKRVTELDDEPEPEEPVAVGGIIVTSVPERTGGFVLLLFVSIYASDIGKLRQFTTGEIVNFGTVANASGRI